MINLQLHRAARYKSESQRPDLWWDVDCWTPALGIQGAIVNNLANVSNKGTISGPSWGAGLYGPALIFGDSSHRVTASIAHIPSSEGTVTIVCRPSWNSADIGNKYLFDSYGGSNARFLLYVTAGNIILYTNGISRGSISVPLTAYTWYVITLVYGRNELYINGASVGSFTGANLGTPPDTLYIGDRYTNATRSFEGAISLFGIHRGSLSDANIRDLSADPLLPFRRKTQVSFYVPSGGPATSIPVIMNHYRRLRTA